MPRRKPGQPPIGNPVSSGKGINEPLSPAMPRGDQGTNTGPRSKFGIRRPLPAGPPGRLGGPDSPSGPNRPGLPPVKPGDAAKQPIPRTTQDDISRPITSPSVTKPAAPPTPPKPAAPGLPAAPGALPTSIPIPGQEVAGSGLAQGAPGDGVPLNTTTGQPMTSQEQQLTLQQEAQTERQDTSGVLSGMDAAKAQEDLRKAQPSPIASIPQGTYEAVVKDKYEQFDQAGKAPLSPEQHARFKEDAHAQLEVFGDYPGKGDPKAPPPPIRPGGRSFNPFSGKFTGERGPNAFKLMGFDFEKAKQEFYRSGGKG